MVDPVEQALSAWQGALWMLPAEQKLNAAVAGRGTIARARRVGMVGKGSAGSGHGGGGQTGEIVSFQVGGPDPQIIRYICAPCDAAAARLLRLPGQLQMLDGQPISVIPRGRRGWSKHRVFGQTRDTHEVSLSFWWLRGLRGGRVGDLREAVALLIALRGASRQLGVSGTDHRLFQFSIKDRVRFAHIETDSTLLEPSPIRRLWRRLEHRYTRTSAHYLTSLSEKMWRMVQGAIPELQSESNDLMAIPLRRIGSIGKSNPEQAALSAILVIAHALRIGRWDRIIEALSQAHGLPIGARALSVIDAQTSEYSSDAHATEGTFRLATNLFLQSIGHRVSDPASFLAASQLGIMGLAFPVAQSLRAGEALPRAVEFGADAGCRQVTRWIMAGPAPHAPAHGPQSADEAELVLLDSTPTDAAITARLARQGQILRLRRASDLRVAPYSNKEEALSAASARLARVLVDELRALIPGHPAQSWLAALELSLDDLVFSRCIDFWSLLLDLHSRPEQQNGILTQSLDWAAAWLAGRAAMGLEAPALSTVMPYLDLHPDAAPRDLTETLVHAVCPGVSEASQRTLALALASAASPPPIPDPNLLSRSSSDLNDWTLLVGRSFDRNYQIDLAEIGRALKSHGNVAFVPTAGQRGRNPLTMLNQLMSGDWHDAALPGPLISMSSPLQTLGGHGEDLCDLLIHQAVQRGALDLTGVALALATRRSLKPFFARRLPQLLSAGARLSTAMAQQPLRAVVLLPARDYLAQVAMLEARRQGVTSFDVQTVFVGPRSRYKATLADYQMAIESHSMEVFKNYFGLAPSRILLSGCAKVGIVQQKARGLDQRAILRKAGFSSPPLVFAGSPFLEADRPILEALVAALPAWPERELAIRMHPTAHQDYESFCRDLVADSPRVRIETSLDLAETLTIAGILVTRFSNVGLEAGLLGRDVIACDFADEFMPIRLDDMGVAATARSPSELCALIDDLLSHGRVWQSLSASRSAYLKSNPQLLLENAGQNIAALIERHSRP